MDQEPPLLSLCGLLARLTFRNNPLGQDGFENAGMCVAQSPHNRPTAEGEPSYPNAPQPPRSVRTNQMPKNFQRIADNLCWNGGQKLRKFIYGDYLLFHARVLIHARITFEYHV